MRENIKNELISKAILFLCVYLYIIATINMMLVNMTLSEIREISSRVKDMTTSLYSHDCISFYQRPKSKVEEDKEDKNEVYITFAETEIMEQIRSNFVVGQECSLPVISTNVKLFTDYRSYNLWFTPHYRLQQAAWTDEQGFRRYNDDYIVALGSYYSVRIGDRFEITLSGGKTFTVIFGDGKADIDCDSRNMYTPCFDYEGNQAANLLEFIIDKDKLPKEIYGYGSLDKLEDFNGDIVKMIYIGRDTSADWDTYEVK